MSYTRVLKAIAEHECTSLYLGTDETQATIFTPLFSGFPSRVFSKWNFTELFKRHDLTPNEIGQLDYSMVFSSAKFVVHTFAGLHGNNTFISSLKRNGAAACPRRIGKTDLRKEVLSHIQAKEEQKCRDVWHLKPKGSRYSCRQIITHHMADAAARAKAAAEYAECEPCSTGPAAPPKWVLKSLKNLQELIRRHGGKHQRTNKAHARKRKGFGAAEGAVAKLEDDANS
jgi:hypothetical protein